MKSIIRLEDVSFTYGQAADVTPALAHVTLGVHEGEILGIIGPSGAGKSTLCHCLSGAIPHHFAGTLYGAVLVDGRDTCEISLTDIARVVGSVQQDIDAQMVASVVEDELLFGLENFGVPHEEIEARIDRALGATGIKNLREREIATLSGGQKQKVALAAILALQPRVLVLDEPTAALDPASSTRIFDTLRDINRELGITVIVVEQKVALLSRYCDRVAVMDAGEIALLGAPHEVFAHAEELRTIGVDTPRMARIYNSLATEGLFDPVENDAPCLDVDAAFSLIASLVGVGDGPDGEAISGTSERASGSIGAGHPTASDAPTAPDEPAHDAAVVFEHVNFAYPAGAAVTDISLRVEPGEVTALVGQNGAGKTTLTKLLTGLLKPNSGTVNVCGMDTLAVPTSTIARKVSTLFQNPDRQICCQTVHEEIAFGLTLRGVDPTEASERAAAVAQRFGLPLDAAPFSLSRGQRQLVALASVVVTQPQVIVLDEPTSGLDYRECMTVMQTVREMAQHGCAVVMVCHDMEVVSDFADRIAVMADGRILACGESRGLFADADLMRSAFVEAPQVIALAQRLAREVSPAFAHISEVSDIVRTVKEMICRG